MGSIVITSCNPKVSTTKSKKHCIELATPGRSYWVAADNPEEMHTWIRCIKEASQQCFQSMRVPVRSATAFQISKASNSNSDNFQRSVTSSSLESKSSRANSTLPANYIPDNYENYEPSYDSRLGYLDEEPSNPEEEEENDSSSNLDADAKQFVRFSFFFLFQF